MKAIYDKIANLQTKSKTIDVSNTSIMICLHFADVSRPCTYLLEKDVLNPDNIILNTTISKNGYLKFTNKSFNSLSKEYGDFKKLIQTIRDILAQDADGSSELTKQYYDL